MTDKIDEMFVQEGKWVFGRVWTICAILFMFVSYLWFSSWSVVIGVGIGAAVSILFLSFVHRGRWEYVVDMSFPEWLTEVFVLVLISTMCGFFGTVILQ